MAIEEAEEVGEEATNTMIKEVASRMAIQITMMIQATCMRIQEVAIKITEEVGGVVIIRTTPAIREAISTKDVAEAEAEVDIIQGIGDEDVSAWSNSGNDVISD